VDVIGTVYPSATDSFSVPLSPSTTPLSSAGSGSTRNHVGHHRDLGDAVMALQNNVTQLTHVHNGTGLNGVKLLQVNTHESADTDTSSSSLHHTIGAGIYQAASGAHNHDTRYIRLDGSVAQTITGKKTFPSGTDAIAIPDFVNSLHNHTSNAKGGYAAVVGDTVPLRQYVGTSGNIPGDVTKDFFLNDNRFTLPANCGLAGYVQVSYRVSSSSDARSDAFFYLSYNQGGSPAFDTAKNLIIAGSSFSGQMVQHTEWLRSTNPALRVNLTIPIFLAPTSTDRPNMLVIMRVLNNDPLSLQEFNTGLQVYFTSNILSL